MIFTGMRSKIIGVLVARHGMSKHRSDLVSIEPLKSTEGAFNQPVLNGNREG